MITIEATRLELKNQNGNSKSSVHVAAVLNETEIKALAALIVQSYLSTSADSQVA